jgi:hypothetical protein
VTTVRYINNEPQVPGGIACTASWDPNMASATPLSPQDLLMPNGKPIRTKGSKASIREVPGGQEAAEDLFDELTAGGKPVTVPAYPGKMVDLAGGGRAGLRAKSKSGEPTIDVDIPGIPIKKIKFV